MQTKKQKTQNRAEAKFVAPTEHQSLLSEVSGFIAAVWRHDTATALEVGRRLARAQEVLPEKSFGRWVKQDCGMTTRQAWNYTICVKVFTLEQQEQLVACAVKPTLMTTLATAQGDKIEELLARIVAGKRFTVSQLKTLIKGNAPNKAEANLGGTAGLLRAAQAKLKAESDMFGKLAKLILKAVEQADADLRKGKHVAKTTLAAKVEVNSQKASALLSSVVEPVQYVAATPSEWEKARRIMARLGDAPRWPGRAEFPEWIMEHVTPALRFVVHGRPTGMAQSEPEPLPGKQKGAEIFENGEAGTEAIVDDALAALTGLIETVSSKRTRVVDVPPLDAGDPTELADKADTTHG